MRPRLFRALQYGLSISVGWTIGTLFLVTLHAQGATNNITHGDGFNVCYDVSAAPGQPALTLDAAQALSTDMKFDGSLAPADITPTWVASPTTPGAFQAQFPESKFPASAQTFGPHTYVLTIGGAAIMLADGTTIQAGTAVTNSYTEVCKTCGPTVGQPKWIKIVGTIALALVGVFAYFAHH